MTNFTENELIPFALSIIKNHRDGIDTKNLLLKLRELMKPNGEDVEILSNRSDDKFSQKVRNLKSHKTLERKNLVDFVNNKFFISKEGLNYINNFNINVETHVEELNKNSEEISDDLIDQSSLSINILKEWPLSSRTYNVLKNENIIFLGDLLLLDKNSLLNLRNFGKKSLKELNELIKKFKIFENKISIDLPKWEENRKKLIIEHEKEGKIDNTKHFIGLNKAILKDFKKYNENFYNFKKIIIDPQIKTTELEKIIIEDIEYILSLLTDRMVIFFKGRYGYEENYQTLNQLGQKYNITRERVRQLEKHLNSSLLQLGNVDKKSLVNFFGKYNYVSFHKLFPLLDKKFTDTARGTEEISGDKFVSFLENYCGVGKKFFKTPERELWQFDIKKLEEIFKLIPNRLNKEDFIGIIQDNYGYNKFVSSCALEFMQKKKLISIQEDNVYVIKIGKTQEVSQILLNYPNGLPWKKVAELGNKSLSNNHWDPERNVADHSMSMQSNPDIYLSDRGTIKLFKFCPEISNKDEIVDFFINYLKDNNKKESSMESAFKEIIKINKFKNLNFYDARAIIKKFGSEKGIFHSGPSGTNTISFDKNVKRISLKDKVKEIIVNTKKEIHSSEIREKLQKTNENLPLDLSLNDLVEEMLIFRISPGTYLNFDEGINLCDKNEVCDFLNKILDDFEFITAGFIREQINENLGYNLSSFYYDTLSRILAKENNWHYGYNYLSKQNKKEVNTDKYIKNHYDNNLSINENFEILSKKIGISKNYYQNIMRESKNNFNTDWVHQND